MTPLVTPVMGIIFLGSFGKYCFDRLKSTEFGDSVRLFQVQDNLIGSSLVDLFEIWLGDCLRCKLQDDQ